MKLINVEFRLLVQLPPLTSQRATSEVRRFGAQLLS